MHPRSCLGASLLMCLMLFSLDASASVFTYKVKHRSGPSDGPAPVLVIQATAPITAATLTYKGGSDGKTIKLGKLKKGQSREIKLKPGKGKTSYEVKLAVKSPQGEGTLGFTFDTVRVAPITLKVDREQVDPDRGKLVLHSNRPLARVEVELFSEGNKPAGKHTHDAEGRSGNIEVTWPAVANVSAIRLTAHDVDGMWAAVLLEPWWIEIKHEEIVFDSGKDSWQPSEEPKLKASLAEIKTQMKRYPKHRNEMRLYIAGYTDTVGKPADNQRLSEARARSIAQWFKRQGVGVTLYYQGFGEAALAVKTPDETPNEHNRRALYVLGNAAPPRSATLPRAAWKRLP